MTSNGLVESNNATALQQPAHVAGSGISPMVQMMVDSGQATVEKMGELMSLQERWEANEARKAFHAAKAAAAAELPMIVKNRQNDHLRTSYADLDAMIAGAGPVLGRHGLSFDFEYDQTSRDEVITHCVTTHAMGFEKRVKVVMPVMKPIQSNSGKNVTNGCQMVGIAMTYGRRYAFGAAFGIATGDDNDGNMPQQQSAPPVEMLTESDMAEIKKACEGVGKDFDLWLTYMKTLHPFVGDVMQKPRESKAAIIAQIAKAAKKEEAAPEASE